jgi:hypothetical protein
MGDEFKKAMDTGYAELKSLGKEIDERANELTADAKARWLRLKPHLNDMEKVASKAGTHLGTEIEDTSVHAYDELVAKLKDIRKSL